MIFIHLSISFKKNYFNWLRSQNEKIFCHQLKKNTQTHSYSIFTNPLFPFHLTLFEHNLTYTRPTSKNKVPVMEQTNKKKYQGNGFVGKTNVQFCIVCQEIHACMPAHLNARVNGHVTTTTRFLYECFCESIFFSVSFESLKWDGKIRLCSYFWSYKYYSTLQLSIKTYRVYEVKYLLVWFKFIVIID